MATKVRANIVSMVGLSKAIDQAVALAAKRQDVIPQPGTIVLNWEIIGRRIKATKDFNAAMTLATEITKSLKFDGIKPQPMVSKFGGDILVGFLERGLLPRQLG